MKSRINELIDRSVSAMAGAVEIYNKPGFSYRNESFAILAINAWELLLKAKWLTIHNSNIRSLYVYERRTNKSGTRSTKEYIKRTRSKAPFTHDLAYLARRLRDRKDLDSSVYDNLEAMLEFRDCAIHFYNESPTFRERLYEIGAACVLNFATISREWFNRDVGEFDIQLMPLSFINLPTDVSAFLFNVEEKQFLTFLDGIYSANYDVESAYSVAVNVDFRLIRSKNAHAIGTRNTTDSSALELRISEENIREKYPWDYSTLTKKCEARYRDFKVNHRYHSIRKSLQADTRFAHTRLLDPSNPNSSKKLFFSPHIIVEFDKQFQKM